MCRPPRARAHMRVLVTGASGFVGRHLTRALAAHDVVPFVGDVRDAKAYAALGPVDVVYHLAARASVPDSIRDPAATWDVNVNGTLRLLEWARGGGARRVVLVSSAHVYGKPERAFVDETHPLRPVTPYGASKLAAEALAQSYHATYGLETVVVRPFNMYGPGQAGGFVLQDILQQLKEGRKLTLGDPRPVRDFTYITDAVDMLARAGASPAAVGRAFNLGTGQGHSIAELLDVARKVTGSTLQPASDPARFRPAEILELVVDSRLARETLGWTPRIGLEEGVRRTWEAMA